jgi:protein TonB
MASVGGAAVELGARGEIESAEKPLFQSLVISNTQPRRSGLGWGFSAVTHGVILAAAIIVPILWPSEAAEAPDYVKALLYNPPPPPPPPLPKGSALVDKREAPKPVTREPEKPKTTPAFEAPREEPVDPQPHVDVTEQAGSPTGSDAGVADGSEVGVDGGVVGGVPGGVLGGVIGGTGDGPVVDVDQMPRPIKQTRPQYPQEAFVKKIEGTVIVEILIDTTGRVTPLRIMQSIPALDQAAMDTVRQWLFSPAIKHGRPVKYVAQAPISFRIF